MIKYTFAALILCVLIASCTADSYRKVRFRQVMGKYQYDAGASYGGKHFDLSKYKIDGRLFDSAKISFVAPNIKGDPQTPYFHFNKLTNCNPG